MLKYLSIPEKLMLSVLGLALISVVCMGFALAEMNGSITITFTIGKPVKANQQLTAADALAYAIPASAIRPIRYYHGK